MPTRLRLVLLASLILSIPLSAAAQTAPGVVVDGRGVTWASPDGVNRVTMRFRIQELMTVSSSEDEPFNPEQVAFQVRRARLRFGGTLLDPRLGFNLQLSFTRGDQDWADTGFPNVLRDATVTWRFTPHLQGIVGQTKLPGNRQRVISSSDLEFPERSIVNNRFTFDRDVGVQLWWADTLGGTPVHLRTALSGGEGRNPAGNDDGVAWTARAEVQPLGAFADGSDDFEGDLTRQAAPRLALAVSAQQNNKTTKVGGQLGLPLHAARTMRTLEADVLFKHRGVALYGEFAKRTAEDPITTRAGSANRYVYTGTGRLLQASYALASGWSPQLRWAVVTPDEEIADEIGAARQEQLSVGLTRYFKRHRIKSTGELLHDHVAANAAGAARKGWILRWAVELGI
jgi:hypothetical protein